MMNKIMGYNNRDSWAISLPSCSPSRFEESVVTASLGKSTRVSDNDNDIKPTNRLPA